MSGSDVDVDALLVGDLLLERYAYGPEQVGPSPEPRTAHFTRTFGQWVGCPPSAYRGMARAAG